MTDYAHPHRDDPEEHQKALEERVRKVRHLDPFSLTVHPDGRFTARLDTAMEKLDPEVAGSILDELAPVLARLREAADG